MTCLIRLGRTSLQYMFAAVVAALAAPVVAAAPAIGGRPAWDAAEIDLDREKAPTDARAASRGKVGQDRRATTTVLLDAEGAKHRSITSKGVPNLSRSNLTAPPVCCPAPGAVALPPPNPS